MKRRSALIMGLAYAALVIIFRLVILLGGYTFSTFGFYYASLIAGLMIIPFYIGAISSARRNNGGVIAGREALRVALTVLTVGVIVTGLYNYAEFQWKGRELAQAYYPGKEYREYLSHVPKIKAEDHDRIIAEQIQAAEHGAFRATTAKVFYALLVGLPAALLCAAAMKRRPR